MAEGKAKHLEKGLNPRFVLTLLYRERWKLCELYEDLHCTRGETENRIKEQLIPFADCTSTALLRSNRIRLYYSLIAYALIEAVRRSGVKQTNLARAQSSTIRLKRLKVGALIRITVRRVWVSMVEGYPYPDLFVQTWTRLRASHAPC